MWIGLQHIPSNDACQQYSENAHTPVQLFQLVIPYGLGLLMYVPGITSHVRQDIVDLSVFMGIKCQRIKERPEHFFSHCLGTVVEYRRRCIVVIRAAGKDTRWRVRLCKTLWQLFIIQVVSHATRWTTDESPFDSRQGENDVSLLQSVQPTSCARPPSYSVCIDGACPGHEAAHVWSTPVLRLRMNGAMRQLPYVYSWRVQGQIYFNFLCRCAVWSMFLVDSARRYWSLLISGFFKDRS